MKKIRMFLCLLLSIGMLCSCNNNDSESNNSSIEDEEMEIVYLTELCDIYRNAGDVYRGKLIEVEKDYIRKNGSGAVIITVEVSYTFKGIFSPGTIITDVFADHREKEGSSVEAFGLEIGAEYLFMMSTGWVGDSPYRAIKLLPENKIEYYYGEGEYSNYTDLVYNMLMIDKLEEIINRNLNQDISENNEIPNDKFLSAEKLIELSENVYFGEVLEFTEVYRIADITTESNGKTEKRRIPVLKIKVKVFSSVKGTYEPGEIIEDIIVAGNDALWENNTRVVNIDFGDLIVDEHVIDHRGYQLYYLELLSSSYGGYPGIYFSAKGMIDDESYEECLKISSEEWSYIKRAKPLIRDEYNGGGFDHLDGV